MEYTIKRVRRSRSIRVRVEPGGAVVVTTPYLIPKFMIDRFVKQSEPWIERQIKRTQLKTDLFPTLDWDKKIVSYLGKLYAIRVMSNGTRVMIKNQDIQISPVTGLESDAKKMLLTWLKKEGEAYVLRALPEWAGKMSIKYGSVIFRQQKSRWGSCSYNANLSFNWRLVHFNPEIIDYVLIHELSHIKHHDHSPRFWELVARFDPHYKLRRQFLHKQVVTLE